jgi:hypothetical protein
MERNGLVRAAGNKSIDRYREARRASREAKDRAGEAAALHGLGHALWDRGKHSEAARAWIDAAMVYHELDDGAGLGWSVLNVGMVAWLFNDDDYALARFAEAEHVFRVAGIRRGVACAIDERVWILHEAHRHVEASRAAMRALVAFALAGQPVMAAWALVRAPLDLAAHASHKAGWKGHDMQRNAFGSEWNPPWGRGGRWSL